MKTIKHLVYCDGGRVSESVSKKTVYLLTGEEATANPLRPRV